MPIATEEGNGQLGGIGKVDGGNVQAMRRWFEPLVRCLDDNVIVADDLTSYRKVAQNLEPGYQVCQLHVRR